MRILSVALESMLNLGKEQEQEPEQEEGEMQQSRGAASRCLKELAEVDGNRTHLGLE